MSADPLSQFFESLFDEDLEREIMKGIVDGLSNDELVAKLVQRLERR